MSDGQPTTWASGTKRYPSQTLAKMRLYRWRRQGGGEPTATCEACGVALTGKTVQAPHLDHNHGTGQFRGWLCRRCNTALGMAGDNPVILQALADYLKRTTCSPTRPLIR